MPENSGESFLTFEIGNVESVLDNVCAVVDDYVMTDTVSDDCDVNTVGCVNYRIAGKRFLGSVESCFVSPTAVVQLDSIVSRIAECVPVHGVADGMNGIHPERADAPGTPIVTAGKSHMVNVCGKIPHFAHGINKQLGLSVLDIHGTTRFLTVEIKTSVAVVVLRHKEITCNCKLYLSSNFGVVFQ